MAGLWESLIRFEREKIAPGTALRNAIGVALPLLAGAATGHIASGLIACTGALNVSFTDGRDPYNQRAGRMAAAALFCASAVFVGAYCGNFSILAILVTVVWAFAAGMLVALDQTAADIGTISLVTLLVFGWRAMSLQDAALSGVLALAGGLLQTVLAVAFWPLRRYDPERRALGNLYQELARAAESPVHATLAPPATTEITEAQKTLSPISTHRSVEADRHRLLLSQAERIRLSLMFLGRLRARLQREGSEDPYGPVLDEFFAISARLLHSIGESLISGAPVDQEPGCVRRIQDIGEEIRRSGREHKPVLVATLEELQFQVDAFAGQLRSALELASHAIPEGSQAFEKRERRRPLHLRLVSAIPTLRANLSLDSAACRHAIRLSVSVGIAEAIARGVGWERPYWLPMTAAIVLKPDFTATFSRGVLRLAGTFGGLVLATVLFHFLPPSFLTHFTIIVVFTFLLRCFGPANYGIFTVMVSALVVGLVGLSGVPASATVAARGLNTAIGGFLALIAYGLWPTWERFQTPEMLARMLDSYRDYFHVVREAYLHTNQDYTRELDRIRHASRLVRSNLEASVDRFKSEPRATAELVGAWNSLLATSNRLIHAIMAMEAGLSRSLPAPPRAAFRVFSNEVEILLHSLASALRGSPLDSGDLPDLRASHHKLVESGDSLSERYALINIEADRITNSLNTLTEQVFHMLARMG